MTTRAELEEARNIFRNLWDIILWDGKRPNFCRHLGEDEIRAKPDAGFRPPSVGPSPFAGRKSLPYAGIKRVTTQLVDSLGRKVCIEQGERVACHRGPEQDEANEDEDEGQPPAAAPSGTPTPEQRPQPPGRLTLNNLAGQDPRLSVVIWTDAGGHAEVSTTDAWGKWARWMSMVKETPSLSRFAAEGWSDDPGAVLSDFARLGDNVSDEPDIDHVTHNVLEAFQSQPDAHLAVVTVSSEVPESERGSAPPKAAPPKVSPSPYAKSFPTLSPAESALLATLLSDVRGRDEARYYELVRMSGDPAWVRRLAGDPAMQRRLFGVS